MVAPNETGSPSGWARIVDFGTRLEAWLDRRVVLTHRPDDADSPSLVLDFDLLQFEFVMRAADGIVFQEFNASERKRIVSTLARLAEDNRTAARDIRVMEGGALRRLILERDNSFRVAAVG